MFNNIRWRIALWFIGLSTAAYLIPTILALVLFHASLTASIDSELDGFIASFGHAITIENGRPVLRDWARTVQTTPAHSLVSYQLFDRDGNPLESHFPAGIPILYKWQHEVTANGLTMRTRMTALKQGPKIVGYFQVQLPTNARDNAMRELLIITAAIAPFVLVGLGWSSYLISEKAMLPTKQALLMLRQFVADASHELYTPLSIVQAANESLVHLVVPSGLGSSELEASESALERMEKILDDLMLLSTMEAPEAQNIREPVDLESLLQETTNAFRPKFAQKEIDLSVHADCKPIVVGDSDALQRLLSNIIENAWRYTEPEGRVRIELLESGRNASVVVSDNGSGIPKESLPHIFDRFYRADRSRSRASGGSGLGLSIALAIARSHEGTIEAKSALGRGSVFRVILPIANRS